MDNRIFIIDHRAGSVGVPLTAILSAAAQSAPGDDIVIIVRGKGQEGPPGLSAQPSAWGGSWFIWGGE